MENSEIRSKSSQTSKKIVGSIVLLVGVVLLLKEMHVDLPSWLISWPMLVVVIGIGQGFKHRFQNIGWIFIVLVGAAFLVERIAPDSSASQYTWPIILIGLGVFFIFGKGLNKNECKRRRRWQQQYGKYFEEGDITNPQTEKNEDPTGKCGDYQSAGEEYIDSTSVFGGTKKKILSKSFKGGDVTNIMGGAELNFYHADIQGVAVLDVVQIFGATKIIVPPSWEVVTEMAVVFAGIDDKRSLNQVLTDKSKVLVIKGASIFGGIDIRNF